MKYAAALALCAASCSPVPVTAIDLEEGKVAMSQAEWLLLQKCKEQGGCLVVSKQQLEAAFVVAAKIALQSCRRENI